MPTTPCRSCNGDDQLPHLSGVDPNDVQKDLIAIVADPEVVVTRNDNFGASLASPLRPDVTAAYTKAVHMLHPGAPISPEMSTGASDARPFRIAGIPIYGADGAWLVVPVDYRNHGRDERLPVKALDDDVAHWKILISELAGK